ncbi:LysR family transcriptional regulator [Antrihabitans cavernicola]|uniref:LysR family transcriptional regulator n=1 Tax=Antrihabitans cavernicola TaxID=2495913 RepID=A0A5A7S872_9NOCA|nr:LysR family transcriptional regulator [Spelaeibacter cavernicola]KAA0020074.1 LysR family transcriptional regulator [Spelaeibacter cavernicola]
MDVIRHLRFFVAVAEEGHFGRAAASLGMTQPPVSLGVRRLEERLGLALFERSSRGVALTQAGAQLLPRARLLVADAARFDDEARRLTEERGATRWGMTTGCSDRLLTACVGSLRSGGAAQVATTIGATTDLVEQVRAGGLDLAVIEHPAVTTGLHCGPVVTVPRWVVVPADHAAARARTAQVRTLRGLALATLPRDAGPPAYDLFRDLWRERGLDPQIVESDGDTALFAKVAAGGCFGVTTTVPTDIPGIAWISLLPDRIALRLRIVRRSKDEHDDAAHALDRVLLQGRKQ